jgi:hypothetical protein
MRRILTTSYYGLTAFAAIGRLACRAAVLATSFYVASGSALQAQVQPDVTMMPSALAGKPLGTSGGLVSGPMANQPIEYALQDGSGQPPNFASVPYTQPHGGGYFDGSMMGNSCPTPGCDVAMYINYEALYLRREGDENFSLSRLNRMEPFDYEMGRIGGRITAGRLFDCHNGMEVVYTGPFKWRRTSDVSGAGTLDSVLFPSDGYTAASIDTFNSADQHVQTYEARLNSYEINRTWWTWDVLQTLVGVRYVNYEEDYAFSTARTGVGNGLLLNSVNNRAVGAQIGAMFMKPASLRTNYGVRGKAAVMANFDSSDTFLSNAGTVLLSASDSSVDLAGLLEMGVFVNYQIVPSVRVTGGYEFLYLPGFGTVPGQSPARINPGSGTSVQNDGDPFFHGASGGVQILF